MLIGLRLFFSGRRNFFGQSSCFNLGLSWEPVVAHPLQPDNETKLGLHDLRRVLRTDEEQYGVRTAVRVGSFRPLDSEKK